MRIITILLLLTYSLSHAAKYELQQALDENLVNAHFTVNDEYTHYTTPFVVQLTNLTDELIEIDIANGILLMADLEENQNFIVTEQLLVNLAPNQKIVKPIHAMCIERFDDAPGDEDNYTLGSLANEQMRQLSTFVQENEYFEPDAQQLMWDIADNQFKDIAISSFFIDEYHEVWAMVKNENNEEERHHGDIENSEHAMESLPQVMVEGSFTMNFSREKNVHIALFNMQNVLVDEVYKNPQTPKGETTLEYAYNSREYEVGEYYLKVVVDGRIAMQKPVRLTWE